MIKEVDLGALELSSSFAFAFWGGDFYFSTDSLGTIPIQSKITKLDYTGDGSVTMLVSGSEKLARELVFHHASRVAEVETAKPFQPRSLGTPSSLFAPC